MMSYELPSHSNHLWGVILEACIRSYCQTTYSFARNRKANYCATLLNLYIEMTELFRQSYLEIDREKA